MNPTTPHPWWTELFEVHDGAAYNAAHWSAHHTMGERPALLVIDVVRSFTGDEGQSAEEATAVYPTACGPNAWTAMPQLKRTIDLAVAHDWPVVYTTGMPGSVPLYGGTVKAEMGGLGSPMDLPGAQEVPDAIAPPPGSLVFAKPKASAFFDTALTSYLLRRRVDTLILIGATTSGCVRATAIDAHSHGFRTFVVEDAVFDRSRLSHGVNLFEMNAKYAEVVTAAALEGLVDPAP
jgi:nicotinamidase-related amidase